MGRVMDGVRSGHDTQKIVERITAREQEGRFMARGRRSQNSVTETRKYPPLADCGRVCGKRLDSCK